jgi:hypothetical protein
MVENDVAEMARPLADRDWDRVLAILDQGELGSCTGNAGTGSLGTEPFYSAGEKSVSRDPDDAGAGEEFAVQPYSDASRVDAYQGSTRPTTPVPRGWRSARF